MTQHTSRLCNACLTKKESDGVLHQMTWPPQSSDVNPIEMVWDELARKVKENQPTSAQHMWELFQDCWKSLPGEAC
jgi:transposase